MKKPPGAFNVLEGISGSGKSTQHQRLQKEFPGAFFSVEPTNNLLGAIIRSVYNRQPYPKEEMGKALKYCEKGYGTEGEHFWLLAMHALNQVKSGMMIDELNMQILYMADRAYDISELSLHCRSSGIPDFKDRYLASTLAYGASGGLDMEELVRWQMMAFKSFGITEEVWKPDLMIIFDLDPELAMRRLKDSGKIIDIFEEKLERLVKIRENYLLLARRSDLFPQTVVIDANNSPDNVFSQVLQSIKLVTA